MTLNEEMEITWQTIVDSYVRDVELANEKMVEAKKQLSRIKALIFKDTCMLQRLNWIYNSRVPCLMNEDVQGIETRGNSKNNKLVKDIISWFYDNLPHHSHQSVTLSQEGNNIIGMAIYNADEDDDDSWTVVIFAYDLENDMPKTDEHKPMMKKFAEEWSINSVHWKK